MVAVAACVATCGTTFAVGADAPSGGVSLFDGTSLDGWHVSEKTGHSVTSTNTAGGRWVVDDSAIIGGQTPTITPRINGVKMSDWTETEARHPAHGRIALQVHGGGSPADDDGKFARHRGIRVREL